MDQSQEVLSPISVPTFINDLNEVIAGLLIKLANGAVQIYEIEGLNLD